MARIDDLKRKLAARQGKPEYKKNCAALQAEIARLGAEEFIPLPSDKEF